MHAGRGLITAASHRNLGTIRPLESLDEMARREQWSMILLGVRSIIGVAAIVVGFTWLVDGWRGNEANGGGPWPNLLFTGLYLMWVCFVFRLTWWKQFLAFAEWRARRY